MAKVNISENKKPPNIKKKPAHEIYQDLLKKQKDNELTETFLAKKSALFAQLPPPEFLQSQKLDMIYSSLHEKIKEEVPRESVQTFDELLEAAKCVEETMNPVKKRIRCNFCRHAGHTADVCRKKADFKNSSADTPPDEPASEKREGVRRTVEFQIDDITDEGVLGNCAASCVASLELYNKLKARGYTFRQHHDFVNTVGSRREQDFLSVSCNVKFGHRTIPTTFVIFPQATHSETMLGQPFFNKIVMDIWNDCWYFHEEPTKTYPLLREKLKNDNIIRTGLLFFG